MFSSNSNAEKDLIEFNQKDMRGIRGNEIEWFSKSNDCFKPIFSKKYS